MESREWDTLAGRRALITGGSRGIGCAVAEAMLRDGADVTVAARSGAPLRAAVEKMRETCGTANARIAGVEADVGRIADVNAVMRAVERNGGLDILVNCAGMAGFATVEEQCPEQWDEVVATNLSGAFYCSREAIPMLRENGGGWIFNIGSLAVRNRFPGRAAYCASKAGLQAFSEVLMQEVRYKNIAVCCISPGPVETGFTKRSGGSRDEWRLEPGDVAGVLMQLLRCDRRVLPSLLELRPRMPRAFIRYPLS